MVNQNYDELSSISSSISTQYHIFNTVLLHAVQGRRCSTLHHLPHTQKYSQLLTYIGVYIFLRAAPFSLLVRLFHHLGLCKRSTHAKPKYAKASKYFYLWVRCSQQFSHHHHHAMELLQARASREQTYADRCMDAVCTCLPDASCSRIPTSSGWHPT